ncbi:hypothetical protein N7463_009760 [Penicillium fimorum]|uniref:Uncharacterized protein n=1 Tax=Penicillium fimorum TaxID=1882269 RepID=A0A9X0C0M6_9EURO|nr:hypothetical protein N7463_009760 [Penicillium fimorum]
MTGLLSRIARKLGLVAVHVTVVRHKSGTLGVIESQFSPETVIDVDVHISFPYECHPNNLDDGTVNKEQIH